MEIQNLLVILLFVAGANSQQQRLQKIRFFTNPNCNPQANGVFEFIDRSDLSGMTQNFGSYCVVYGAWRIELIQQQPPSAPEVNVTDGDGCGSCIIKPTNMNSRKYGKIQHLAGKDITKPSLSLYTEGNFGGEEVEVSNVDRLTFQSTRNFASYAFTSFSNWTWQAYVLPNYRGESICLRPITGSEVSIIRQTGLGIGSVRLGCRNGVAPRYKEVGLLLTIIFALAVPSIAVIL